MPNPIPCLLPLSALADQLNAGRPVLLIPAFAALQPPDPALSVVMVNRLHLMAAPGLLRLDLNADCGLLLVEDRRGGRRNG
ncbi:MAG: hypothetical protein ACOYO0_05035 [Sandarakinorhabdus sp.]